MAETAEVVVVGAGPTGLMLACELAGAGVGVVVLERLAERTEQVKGGGVQPRTLELLDARGLLAPMLRHALAREEVGGHFAMLPVPLDCTPWRTRHPYPVGVPQWRIEEVLQDAAGARGARVLRGAEVAAVAPDAGGVTVTTADGRSVRALWAVACDGGRSTVRKALGVPFPGRDGTFVSVLADIRLAALSPLVPRTYGHASAQTREANGHWAMLTPISGDRYRVLLGRTEGPAPSREAPVGDEEIATALKAVYGAETELAEVLYAGRFTDATRQVERYREGRVLFAGDAAHIHAPLGGQGTNLGIQDAINLGWKLAATVRGHAPEGLLDTYHAERHPVAAQVLHHTSAQRVLADPKAPADVAALRDIVVDLLRLPDTNRHLAGLMSGLALHYDLPGSHPLTGHRLPDLALDTPAGPAHAQTAAPAGHALLLDLAGALPAGLPLPPLVTRVNATTSGELDATAVLVRPDGYACWATSEGSVPGETVLGAVRACLTTEAAR
jgi:2-polyprenyl-6-methoxyphenol hydroxylase-like FAD-dependent oxidoreductase